MRTLKARFAALVLAVTAGAALLIVIGEAIRSA